MKVLRLIKKICLDPFLRETKSFLVRDWLVWKRSLNASWTLSKKIQDDLRSTLLFLNN